MKDKLIKEIQNLIYDSKYLSEEQKEKYFKFFELLKDYPGKSLVLLLGKIKKELISKDEERIKLVFDELEKNLSLIEQDKGDEIFKKLSF